MMRNIYIAVTILVLLLLFISCGSTQQLGKIYTLAEADDLFGKVINSVEIPADIIEITITKTEKNIMFGIINNDAVVLDNNRNLLYPSKVEIKETDVCTVYSVSVLKELLSKGTSQSIKLEQRKEVLSVTYDKNTMELGTWCPPFCSDTDNK